MAINKETPQAPKKDTVVSCSHKKSTIGLWVIFSLCFIAFIVSASLFISSYSDERAERETFTALEAIIQSSTVSNAKTVEETAESSLAYLYEENNDFAGWLSIDGTAIHYPVMLTPSDPEYYLRRDFYGKSSISGVPFIGEGCNLESDNIIVYGHNMKNGTMFADLTKYSEQDYWETHPDIVFETLEELNRYEIIAVFQDRVHTKNETDAFRFYSYGGVLSKELFDDYIKTVQEKSLYDTGVNAIYGDQLLTLSTCSYHVKDGRFVVVARQSEKD